jgi:acetamidase/formamidase
MEHRIDEAPVHHDWDNGLDPVLEVASGDVVAYDLRMAGHGQIAEGDRYEDTALDFATLYHLAGPVWVEGAEPGDTLRVDILELAPGPWGWASILPGMGLLPDDFPDPVVWTFDLRERDRIAVAPGVSVPIVPFLGTMGTHPDDPATAAAFPPHKGGGNVDTRHLRAGVSLYLPIWVEGALFSCGDPHAAQGDGEVCVTAVECPMRARLRLTVEKRSISAPTFVTPGALTPEADVAGYRGTMGLHADLMEGARAAVRASIDWIEAERGLTREQAYLLCSLAGDLKIHEVVDSGVWNVGMTIPLSVFDEVRAGA